jgi:undecaprenyl diphosphate synthase
MGDLRHLAVILDGNGRWAKAKGMPRTYGHMQGARTVEDMCRIVWDHGIEYFTVYAFSTENWSRPEAEVSALMKLLRDYMKNSIKRATKNNMKVRVIGDKSALAEDIRESIEKLAPTTMPRPHGSRSKAPNGRSARLKTSMRICSQARAAALWCRFISVRGCSSRECQ